MSPISPGDGSLDPVQKKIRNLSKKVSFDILSCHHSVPFNFIDGMISF
jgi:hypothetical protein